MMRLVPTLAVRFPVTLILLPIIPVAAPDKVSKLPIPPVPILISDETLVVVSEV